MSYLTRSITLISTFLIATHALSGDSLKLAPKRAVASEFSLWPRATFYGGVALSATSCPKDTIACDGPTHLMKGACCPTNTVCMGNGLNSGVVCCPGKDDCSETVTAAPSCADSKWELYKGFINDFCCQPGQKGVESGTLTNINGLCIPEDAPLSTSSASKINTAAETGTASSAEDTASSTSSASAQSKTPGTTGSATTTAATGTSAGSTAATGKPTGAASSLIEGQSVSKLAVLIGAVGIFISKLL